MPEISRSSLGARRGIKASTSLKFPDWPSNPSLPGSGDSSAIVLHGQSNSFVLEKLLGFGSSSFAYLSTSPNDGTRAVVKRMKDGDGESRNAAAREYRLLKMLDHRNIIRVLDSAEDMSWIALEYLDGSATLSDQVKAKGPLETKAASAVFRNLASAVFYMHELNVCHRDVKPANVLLVGTEGDLRIFDFNASYEDCDGVATECVSPVGDMAYRAPEVGSETTSYGFGVDIWGIGATMYFALTAQFMRRKLFQDEKWNAVIDTLKEPISLCLRKDPVGRPTAALLLELLCPSESAEPN
jgi:serine/threonine protein kinase